MFHDRKDAGEKLGAELAKLQVHDAIVLALLPGGVPVAVEVAKALNAPLDLLIVCKVGAPGNPEVAVAALVDGEPPDVVLNREIIETYALDDAALRALISAERSELERRRLVYRGNRKRLSVAGKTTVVVDDGAATGTTIKVAIRALKRRSPKEIIVAIPVSPPDALADLARETERVICLSQPGQFRALSHHFLRFPQISDEEVTAGLIEANSQHVIRYGKKSLCASAGTNFDKHER